ncbi:MAG: VanZ family protein [Chloroflexi bacterium]|nr:VanZ family protein [Chloroflexota bacterium]MCH8009141.1 VanZ family protein [Chloroflexota bacterium]
MLTKQRMRVNEFRFSRILRAARWLPAILWMFFLFYLSHQAAPLERVASNIDPFLAHVAVYSVLAFLLHIALSGYNNAAPRWVPVSIAFALAVLYGVGDEIHQAYVPGRVASELDLVADGIGAAIGVSLASLAASRIYARLTNT